MIFEILLRFFNICNNGHESVNIWERHWFIISDEEIRINLIIEINGRDQCMFKLISFTSKLIIQWFIDQ